MYWMYIENGIRIVRLGKGWESNEIRYRQNSFEIALQLLMKEKASIKQKKWCKVKIGC